MRTRSCSRKHAPVGELLNPQLVAKDLDHRRRSAHSAPAAGGQVGPCHPVYLDAATAAPLHPVARQALLAALDDGWADPARLYSRARRARQLLDAAREATAPTSASAPTRSPSPPAVRTPRTPPCSAAWPGGSAAATTLVHSAIEHSAVLHAAERHVATGGTAISVPVDRLGRLDLAAWSAAVHAPGVALAALIGASHEVGTVQPVAGAAAACAAAGVPLHVDAAQSVGRVPVPDGLVGADRQRAQVGRSARRRACWWSARAPAGSRRGRPTSGSPGVPPGW